MTVSPRTLAEALERLDRAPDLVPIAGCTDLMVGGVGVAEGVRHLDLLRIEELRGIRREDDHVLVGATTTFAEIGASDLVRTRLPMLARAAAVIGGQQIQNRATIAGNMVNASPAGDSLPVLLALDATVVVAGARGEREIAYHDFHLDYRRTALRPGELVVRLRVPLPAAGSVQLFRKVGTRAAQAISKVVVALHAIRVEDRLHAVRIAAGSVASVPMRLPAAERRCEDGVLGEELAQAVATTAEGEVRPIDDVRSTAEYRRWVLGRVLRRMLLSIDAAARA